MATVPVYGDQRVRTQPLQPVFQNTPDVSSGARALAQGLGTAAEAADRIDLRDAQDEAFKAQTELRNAWQEQRAALREQYKGDTAAQYKTAADEWWKEAKTKYTQTLTPRAQALANRALGEYKLAQDNDTLAYVEREKTRAREINFRTLQDRLVFETGQNVNAENAEAMAGATAKALLKNAIEYADANGFNSDVAEAYVREYTSKLHADVAMSLARTNATAAQAYMNKFGKDLPLAVRNRADDIIKQEGDNQFARVEAARVLALPVDQQKAELAKITDPVRLQKTQIEMNNALAFAKNVQSQQWSAAAQEAFALANSGRPVPAALRARMDQENDVPKLDQLIRARSERLAAGKTVKTNPVRLAELYDMARENPEEFKRQRLTALTEQISTGDIEQLGKLQRDMLKPDTEKDVATTTQVMGLYTGGWKPEKKANFNQAFLDELAKFEREKKRAATYEEKRNIGNKLVIDGEVLSGSIFLPDPNKAYWQATPEERSRFQPTISSGDRKLIRQALQAEGVKNPTEAQIVERFKLAKGM